jgi:hypothetical protein
MGQGPLALIVGILSSLYRSLTNSTADKPIILDSNNRLKNGNNNLNT